MEKHLAARVTTADQPEDSSSPNVNNDLTKLKKTIVMYFTMVAVSTGAIFLLEHATIYGAFRTALVAAIGKTFAANWVSGLFE